MRDQTVHVLVLDDDEAALVLVRRVLERAGHRVSTATTQAAAVAAVESDLPDLIIVDYALGEGATGLEFLRAARQRSSDLPAILVTGFTDEARVMEALRAGVADLVPKIEGYVELLPQVVEKVVTPLRLRREIAQAEALAERERYYRGIAEAIPHLVWTATAARGFDYLSRQWLDYTGLAEEEQVGYQWIERVVHPDDQEATRHELERALSERAPFEMQHRLRNVQGEYRWFKSRGAPVRSAGTLFEMKWFGTCTDIHEQKYGEELLEKLLDRERLARAEAESATRAKDEFVLTLSHELRTPLNAIIGWTELLLRDASDAARRSKGLEVILRNAQLQARMVEEILDMSRILAGRLRLEVEVVDLVEIIDQVLATVHPAADAKGIALVRDVDGTPLIINGDPARLQQMVWNLAMNAIKFTDKGGRVTLGLARDANHALVSVTDTGRGISAEFLHHVFDRFSQEVTGRARPVGGLGLGLALVRQLVEMHGGSVEAFSEGAQRGACFTLRLPIAAPLVQRTRDSGAVGPPERERERLVRVRVLVVEDQGDARDLMQQILAEQGAEVAVAASGQEALAVIRRLRPDVIISDIAMPAMDGFEFIARLRREEEAEGRPPTPAIALTALARFEDRERALAAGFDAHLSKPVNASELIETTAAIGRRRTQPAWFAAP